MNFLGIARRLISSSYQITQLLNANKSQGIKLLTARSISITQPKLEDAKKEGVDINEDVNKKLMEFFDDKKNWNENEVRHGRSWLLPELRIKSNVDLHKIWYILLKERNMLMTMEHEYKRKWRFWASPERIDIIKQSMENLETVVKERNKAYYQLETGVSGQRPGRVQYNIFGLKEYKKFTEHTIPIWKNAKWREENPRHFGGHATRKFLRLYREKILLEKRKATNRDKNHVIRLLRRHPNINDEILAKKYPKIDVDRLRSADKTRGHYVPKVD